jgi:hypothetical protein
VTPDQRRLLSRGAAVALLLSLLAVPAVLVLTPIIVTSNEMASQREDQTRLLASYARTNAQRPAVEARLAELAARDKGTSGLFAGASSDEADATLQAAARKLIEAAGGELHSVQPGKPTPEAGLERIEARFDLTLKQEALAGLLKAIDAQNPYLFADQLQIESSESGKSPTLSLHVTLAGYRRPA